MCILCTDIFSKDTKKYILTLQQYGESDICNIYCDTDDCRIIRASVQKPVYKEKLRLSCYGIPDNFSPCFLELKNGIYGKLIVPKDCIIMEIKTAGAAIEGEDCVKLSGTTIKIEAGGDGIQAETALMVTGGGMGGGRMW